MTEVTRDQSEVHPLHATHRSTEAKVCWPTIAEPDFHFAERGRIGETLENGKVYDENDVLVVGVGLLMELFAKRREMSETPANVEPSAEGSTCEERDAHMRSRAAIEFVCGINLDLRYCDTDLSRENCFVYTGDPNATPGGTINPVTNPDRKAPLMCKNARTFPVCS